jgi:hypothetical protein
MITCEYIFKEFNSRGGDDYLEAWASQVDQLGDAGWEVFECIRRPERAGSWTVLLCRPGQNGSRRKMKEGLSEDRLE